MYGLFLLTQPEGGGGQIAEIARTFGVDWIHLGAQIVSFAILCALLYRFAYHPVLATLAERRRQIAEGLASAERMKADMVRTEQMREQVMKDAGVQANALIEDGRAAAARVQRDETAKAIAAAEQIIAKARQVTAQDHARMLAELKGEVGRLVVQTVAAVTGKVLTADDQRRLSEETVSRLKAPSV
jgi:F-type H+-transporting ATPase subunit b